MICKNLKNRLSAYLDGELDARTSSQIALHLEECSSCKFEFERLQKLNMFLEAEQPLPADPYFLSRLRARLRNEDRKMPVVSNAWRWAARALVPVTIAVGLVFGIFLGTHLTEKLSSDADTAFKISDSYFDEDVFSAIPQGSLTAEYTSLNHWEQNVEGKTP